ncbi:hypothetical protein BZG80_13325 [Salinivibrio sp. MA440]|uniref:O-antigen ligase family protein n=1 Tax=Salinivibrio sp. MA440 TaxID=1909456 RepID=UPI0009897C00|nr:O-antigen ligase family protein [Salinivibrio sp. MA440]OOF02139.1 hypothetical protein BZG80_13325 [Salinivibrio sp. MA440]
MSRQTLVSSLCFAYFATLLITPDAYKYIAVGLALVALILLPGTWKALKSRPALLIAGAFLLYVIVTVAFALPDWHYEQMDMPSRLLLAIMVFALLLTTPPSLKAVLYGCAIGASAVGLIALYQHYMLDIRALASGGFMPIQVAGMAASLSIFSIFAYIYSCQHALPTLKKLAFFGITLGFIATLLSGGRGSWVITPFVALWAVIYYRKAFSPKDYVAMAASIVLIIATALVPALNRAGLVFSDLNQYQQATQTIAPTQSTENTPTSATPAPTSEGEQAANTPTVKSSSGIRVELWKTALHLFSDNPIAGTGYTHYTQHKQQVVDQGYVDPIVMHFSRAHNQLLEELQVKGLIGGITLLFLLIAPWLATKKVHVPARPANQLAAVMLRCHVVLIAGYMLTQHYINHHSGILFFSLGVVIFASMALRGEARG